MQNRIADQSTAHDFAVKQIIFQESSFDIPSLKNLVCKNLFDRKLDEVYLTKIEFCREEKFRI